DQGLNWINVSSGLISQNVFSLKYINDENILYAGTTDSGLYKSTDLGETWIYANLPEWVADLEKSNNNYLLAVTITDGVYRKSSSSNWEKVSDSIMVGKDVYSIFINDVDDIFIGTDAHIFKSSDNGNSWTQKDAGINSIGVIWDFSIDNSGNLYACDGGGFWTGAGIVYLSSDNGENWDAVAITNRSSNSIITMPPQTIYVATDSGVYVSFDNGLTGEKINNGLTTLTTLSLKTDLNNYLYVGTSSGVFRSTNPITSVDNSSFPPVTLFLSQNYPNPFNPNTKISWQSPVGSWQSLIIYDVLGNEVATLVDEYKPAGSYKIEWDASGFPSGAYFYQLKADNYIETKKMILLR
ncbi:MAG: T9SS type A sorting domain-containing protein, partial [Ignavibacteriaceae bacterium]|nr:T9SS type A sorting domain-containing protein [Ignavibacteriaceae bacterium]